MFSSQYHIITPLGQGSFGKVNLVQHVLTSQLLAHKQISLLSISPCQLPQLLKQVQILKTLNHPNVIQFKDYMIQDDNLHILMEYAQNGDLASVIEEKKSKGEMIEEEQVLDWGIQLLEGLQHIHQNRVIHRDLKPHNIFIGQNNILKIGDFGVSTILSTIHTKASTFIGTFYYISPEILNRQLYSQKSDIWSLGVILHQLLMLRRPFEGRSMMELMLRITRGEGERLSRGVSKGLREIIEGMLEVDVERRVGVSELLGRGVVLGRRVEKERMELKREQKRLEQIRRDRMIKKSEERSNNQILKNSRNFIETNKFPQNRKRTLSNNVSSAQYSIPYQRTIKQEILTDKLEFQYSDIVTRLKQSKLLSNENNNHHKQFNPTIKHSKQPKQYLCLPIDFQNKPTLKYNIPLHITIDSLNNSPVKQKRKSERSQVNGGELEEIRVSLEDRLGVERFRKIYWMVENGERVSELEQKKRVMFEESYKEVEELIKMERMYQG